MTLKTDLIAAKALIDTPEKWGRGEKSFVARTGPTCIAGACARTSGGWIGGRYKTMWDALSAKLSAKKYPREYGQHGGDLVTFNDDPNTTHTQIMRLFDRAINAAEA